MGLEYRCRALGARGIVGSGGAIVASTKTAPIYSIGMKAIALVLLFLTPLSAQAQDEPAPRQGAKAGKKLEWIGIGVLAGGISAAIVGVVSGKPTAAYFNTVTPGGTCTSVQAGSSTGASVSGTTCTVLSGISIPTQTTTTTAVTLTFVQHRATNWKITGPAIAGAGAGVASHEIRNSF